MRSILRTLLALLALAVALPAEAREFKKLRIGLDGTYPPFSKKDGEGRIVGFDPEMAAVICARLAVECEYLALGWNDLVPALLSRRVDLLVASQPITDDARRAVEFTNRYYRIAPRFVARASDLARPTTRAALKGVRVGVRAGTAHAAWLAAERPEAQRVELRNEAEAGAALVAGRVDLVFGDTLALYEWLDRAAPRGAAAFTGEGVEAPRLFGDGAGIAFRREDRDLGQLVDKVLHDIGRDGTFDRLAGRWFPFAIR